MTMAFTKRGREKEVIELQKKLFDPEDQYTADDREEANRG